MPGPHQISCGPPRLARCAPAAGSCWRESGADRSRPRRPAWQTRCGHPALSSPAAGNESAETAAEPIDTSNAVDGTRAPGAWPPPMSFAQASRSCCDRRTSPHGMYNHTDPASSGIDQWTLSHGSPADEFSVASRRRDPDQTAFGRGPDRAVGTRTKVEDAHRFGALTRHVDPRPSRKWATLPSANEPEAAMGGIRGNGGREGRCAELREAVRFGGAVGAHAHQLVQQRIQMFRWASSPMNQTGRSCRPRARTDHHRDIQRHRPIPKCDGNCPRTATTRAPETTASRSAGRHLAPVAAIAVNR